MGQQDMKTLIKHIHNSDLDNTKNAFQQIISQKVFNRLEDMKIEYAQTSFLKKK